MHRKKQKDYYDKNRANPLCYKAGALVLVKDFTRKKCKGGKLDAKWIGHVIQKKCTRGVYSVALPNDSSKTKRVTGAHLKLYKQLNKSQDKQGNHSNVCCNSVNTTYLYTANDQEECDGLSVHDYEDYSDDSDDNATDDYSPDDRGNYSPDDRGNYSPDDRGNYSPDDHGNYSPDDRGNYSPDDRGNYSPDDRGKYLSDDRGNYSPDDHGNYLPDDCGNYFANKLAH